MFAEVELVVYVFYINNRYIKPLTLAVCLERRDAGEEFSSRDDDIVGSLRFILQV